MSRRVLLRLTGLSGIWLLMPWSCAFQKEMRPIPGFSNDTANVAVCGLPRGAPDQEVMEGVLHVAQTATDFGWLSRKDTVLIKPASNSGYPFPATTSPLAVRGMVRLLKEKGAGRVILADKPGVQYVYQDGRGHRGSSHQILKANGLHQAAVESGGEVRYFDQEGYGQYFGDRTEHTGHWKSELMLPNLLDRVDHVVVVPRVSRHILAGSTLGMKAAVGWLRDDTRLELHREAGTFLEKIAEINDTRTLKQKLRLTLSVATKVQSTLGPDKGFAAEPDPGLIFGSESLLAHDMTALAWLLWNRECVTPQRELNWYRDPYKTFPGLFNRLFVGYIWGLKEMFRSETYRSVAIRSIRTDPVITRAAEIWGGLPMIELEQAKTGLPSRIRTYLLEKSTI